jgi:hypothetical protein
MFKVIHGKPVHESEAHGYEARNGLPRDPNKYPTYFDHGQSDYSRREQERRDREERERQDRDRI